MFEITTRDQSGGDETLQLDFERLLDVKKEDSDELGLTKNALTVLKRRYLKKDKNGDIIETPRELFRRVARNVASAEVFVGGGGDVKETEEKFFRLMSSLEFMPNSPTLMNAGRELQQLSACFVLPVEDAIDSIFEAVKNTALIHKSGGGTGFSFSRIRPKNDIVSTSHGYASGPISFLKVFNEATEAINQGGFRRGANMGVLRVDHPDILDFVRMKSEDKAISNFNISVGLTEAFMDALSRDEEYDLINPKTHEVVRHLRAKEVHDLIVELAWKNGEPGVVFLDNINRQNPTPALGEIESTNPCGEQPLLPYEACNLGSINLGKVVDGGKVDYTRLRRVVRDSVHFLDNVIEVNRYPLPAIEEMCKGNRKIGLGVMGFADMLIQLGIPYNSESAVEAARDVMRFIRDESHAMSQDLADGRGAFPNFTGSIYDNGSNGKKMRNATVTTIAPTGTISIISNASGGIEPLFAVSYIRNVMDNTHMVEVNPFFECIAKRYEFYSRELMEQIAETGSCQGNEHVPVPIQRLFVTSHDTDPEWHIRIQAAFQEFTDNAVSKTVNFRHDADKEDVRKVYDMAYQLGCKGVTVYRDGSRSDQVLNIKEVNSGDGAAQGAAEASAKPTFNASQPRPSVIKGWTVRMKTGCGNLYVTINEDQQGKPFELFNHIGKAGGCAASQSEAIGRLISFAMRSGADVEPIIQQLKGISCHSHVWGDQGKILSCADAIGKALERYLFMKKGKTASSSPNVYEDGSNGGLKKVGIASKGLHVRGACPICGGILSHEEGCVTCHSCGYSECS
jgi:ribonucleoside-diphosphate reductase alpha chain